MPAARRLGVSSGLVWLLLPGYQTLPNLMTRRKRAGALAADPERRMRLLQGLGIEHRVREAHVLAVIGDGPVLGPQRDEGFQALVGDLAALLERGAQQLELLPHPARAGADDEPAVGEHVDGGEHLGRQHRRPMRHHHHRRQQPQLLGAAGEEGDGGELVEAMAVLGGPERARRRIGIARLQIPRHDQVVADREEVEARALGRLGYAHVVVAVGEDAPRQRAQSELHCEAPVTPCRRPLWPSRP